MKPLAAYSDKPALIVLGRHDTPICPVHQRVMLHEPGRADRGSGERWFCKPHCDFRAQRSSHDGKLRIWNLALTALRQQAHTAFDAIWGRGHLPRDDAYDKLAAALGLRDKDCHFAHFGARECEWIIRNVLTILNCTKRRRHERR